MTTIRSLSNAVRITVAADGAPVRISPSGSVVTLRAVATGPAGDGADFTTAHSAVAGADKLAAQKADGTKGYFTAQQIVDMARGQTTGRVSGAEARFTSQIAVANNGGVLTFGGSDDVQLWRGGVDALEQRRGANPQSKRIYNTYTDASNYERAGLSWSSNNFNIYTESAGTGAARNMQLGTLGAGLIQFVTGGTARWQIAAAGNILPATNNATDIGAPASLVRLIYANQVLASYFVSSTEFVTNSNRGRISSGAADGQIKLTDSANTGFSALIWGLQTAAFPMFKRSGAGLDLRLADDSAFGVLGVGRINAAEHIVMTGGHVLQRTAGGYIALGATDATRLYADADSVLAQRNGVNAQRFSAYSTFTDLSNYERVDLVANAGSSYVGYANAGTGLNRNFAVRGSQVILQSGAAFTNRWIVDGSGHMLGATDNLYDVGAVAANRPRNAYFAGFVEAGNAQSLRIYNQFRLTGNADGVATLSNYAANDFSRLNFGLATSAAPALKRSGAALHVRRGDDSAFAELFGAAIYKNSMQVVADKDLIQPYNPFRGAANPFPILTQYHSVFTNRFLGRNNQVYVTVDGVLDTTLASRLCDGDVESTLTLAAAGEAAKVVNINTVTNGLTSSSGFTYAQGEIWLQFYYGYGPQTVTARWKNNVGAWTALVGTVMINQGGTDIAWRFPVSGNYLTDIEFTITPRADIETRISECEYHSDRMTLDQAGVITAKGGRLRTHSNYAAGTFTATGYLTLYDAAGTAYRVPCAV